MNFVKLGDLCEISTGSTDTKDAVENGEYPLFDRSKKVKLSDKFLFDCEALIMPGEGAEFLPRHYHGKFDLHQRAYAMFNFSDLVDPMYLYYYLISVKDYFSKNAVGATVKSLRRRHFTDLIVPVTSLEQQRGVVQKLDNIFAEIDSLEDNLALSEEKTNLLLHSILNSAFRYAESEEEDDNSSAKVVPILDVFSLEYGKPLDKEFRKPDGEYAAYGANGPISSASKYLIEGPCVIVGRKGSAGEIRYVEENVWPLDVTYYIKHDSTKTDLRYLYYVLKSQNLKRFVRGVKPGLNRNDVYELEIPLPSLEKQQEIASNLDDKLDELETLRSLMSARRRSAVALRHSLIHYSFPQKEDTP